MRKRLTLLVVAPATSITDIIVGPPLDPQHISPHETPPKTSREIKTIKEYVATLAAPHWPPRLYCRKKRCIYADPLNLLVSR